MSEMNIYNAVLPSFKQGIIFKSDGNDKQTVNMKSDYKDVTLLFDLVVLLSNTDNRRITILNTDQMVIIKKVGVRSLFISSQHVYV